MSHSDEIDYINEGTFKNNCRKLYKLVFSEGLRHGINIHTFDFVSAKGVFDVIDVVYENSEKEFVVSVKGSEKGYKIIDSYLSDHLFDEDWEDDYEI